MADEHYRRDLPNGEVIWITPEFALMSRGGRRGRGIAAEWLAKYSADVYPHDHVIHDGRKLRPPRYFDKLLEQWDPVARSNQTTARTPQRNSPRTTPRQDWRIRKPSAKPSWHSKNTHWSKTMKMHIITLRDLKANVYLPPMYVPNLFAAQREISDVLNGTEKREWAKHPEDFELLHSGDWDTETNRYELKENPQQICVLTALVQVRN